jgi:PIN domain nuclease of toxin-antitoxin system
LKILFDTHCILWIYEAPEQINATTIPLITDSRNQLYCSAASLWEMAIKIQIGKLTLPKPLEAWAKECLKSDFIGMSITPMHALKTAQLPFYSDHKDLFDRILIAQALAENCALMTADPNFYRYPGVQLIWAGQNPSPFQTNSNA